jgi:hypothetical protein
VPGDCGSWVLDANDGSVYAMVVASSSFAQESYCIPLSTMLEDINVDKRFEIAFPSTDSVPQSVVNKSPKQPPVVSSSLSKKYEELQGPTDEFSVFVKADSASSSENDDDAVPEIIYQDAATDSNKSVSETGDAAEPTPNPRRDTQSPTDDGDWVRFGKAELIKLAFDTFGDSCMHDHSSRRHILIKRSALVEVRNVIAKGRRRLQKRPKLSSHRSRGYRRDVSEIESKQDSESDWPNQPTIEERTLVSAGEAWGEKGVTERNEAATTTSDFPEAVDRDRPSPLPRGLTDASRTITQHESKSDNKNDATASHGDSLDQVKALLNTMQERMRTQELRVRYLELQLQDDAEWEEYFSIRSARKTQLKAKFRAEMKEEGYSEEQISNLVSHQQPDKQDDKRSASRVTDAAGSGFHESQISPETLDSFGIPWEYAGPGRVRIKQQISPARELKLREDTRQRIAKERIGGKLLLTDFDGSALPEWMRKHPRNERRRTYDSLHKFDPAGYVQSPIELVNNSSSAEERAWGHDYVDEWRYQGEPERPNITRRTTDSMGPHANQERSSDNNMVTAGRGRTRHMPDLDPARPPSPYLGVDDRPLHRSGQPAEPMPPSHRPPGPRSYERSRPPSEPMPLSHRPPRPSSYERPRDSSQFRSHLRPQSIMSVRFDGHDTIYPPPESIATSHSVTDGWTSESRDVSRPVDSPKLLPSRIAIVSESSQRRLTIPPAEPQIPADPDSHSHYSDFNRGSSMASTTAPRDLERELRREKQARKEAEFKSDQNYNIAQELAEGVRRVQTREEVALIERERELSRRERRLMDEERRAEELVRERARKAMAEEELDLSRIAADELSNNVRHSRSRSKSRRRASSYTSRQPASDSDDDYPSWRPPPPSRPRSISRANSAYASRRSNTLDYDSDESLIRVLDQDKNLREKKQRLSIMERELMDRERRQSQRMESTPPYAPDMYRPVSHLRGYGYGYEPHSMPLRPMEPRPPPMVYYDSVPPPPKVYYDSVPPPPKVYYDSVPPPAKVYYDSVPPPLPLGMAYEPPLRTSIEGPLNEASVARYHPTSPPPPRRRPVLTSRHSDVSGRESHRILPSQVY